MNNPEELAPEEPSLWEQTKEKAYGTLQTALDYQIPRTEGYQQGPPDDRSVWTRSFDGLGERVNEGWERGKSAMGRAAANPTPTNIAEAVVTGIVEPVGAVVQTAGAVIETGLDLVTPDFLGIGEAVEETASIAIKAALDTDIGQDFFEAYSDLHPIDKDRVATFGLGLEAATVAVGGGKVRGAVSDYKGKAPDPNKEQSFTKTLASMGVANLRDYLPYWYGAGKAKPTPFENHLIDAREDVTETLKDLGVSYKGLYDELDDKAKAVDRTQNNPIVTGYRKVVGASKALSKDAFASMWLALSPEARALWVEKGVSKNSQKIVADYLQLLKQDELPVLGAAGKTNNGLTYNPKYKLPLSMNPEVQSFLDKYIFRSTDEAKNVKRTAQREAFLDEAANNVTRAMDKATAQVMYSGNHIVKQGNHQPEQLAKSIEELTQRTLLEGGVVYEPGILSALFAKHKGTTEIGKLGNRRDYNNTNEDIMYFEEHVTKVQELGDRPNAVITVKGESTDAGKHYNDVVYKNPVKNTMVKIFQKYSKEYNRNGVVPMDQFVNMLKMAASEKQAKGAKAKKNGKKSPNSFKVLREDEDGVWLTGSIVGSSVIEGGVNWVGKFRNDGSISMVMSDTHDFFEKLPGVGWVLKKVIPTDLIGISPIMNTHVWNIAPENIKTNLKNMAHPSRRPNKRTNTPGPYIPPKPIGFERNRKEPKPKFTQEATEKAYYDKLYEELGINPKSSGAKKKADSVNTAQGRLLQDFVNERPSPKAKARERALNDGVGAGGMMATIGATAANEEDKP